MLGVMMSGIFYAGNFSFNVRYFPKRQLVFSMLVIISNSADVTCVPQKYVLRGFLYIESKHLFSATFFK